MPDSGTPLFALILENHEARFDQILAALREAGFAGRCQRVETEQEYLGLLRERPALILAGNALGGFRAMDLLRLEDPDIPYIVLSDEASEERAVESMKRGVSDYLTKDGMARLGQAVTRALEQSDRRRQERRAAADLQKRQERFQHLVETIKVIPWELDFATRQFTYVGPQAVKLLGHPLDDWYREGFWDEHVHPEDREALTHLEWTGDGGERDHEFTFRMFSRDGAMIYLHCVANTAASGSHAGMLFGFMLDITELKTTQVSLARNAEDLARSNAELRQFANAASHDLQEPLRMVAFYTQLLAKRYKGKLDSDADEFIGYAVEGATRMSALIKHLLEFSRASLRKPEFTRIDCEDVFEASLANLRLAIEESGAKVTHDLLPVVTADVSQIGQVMQNLIGNAIKFRGGKAPSIHVSVHEEPAEWRFSVKDDGIGIEEAYFESIFVIFQRLHGREEYEGSGIGLATCRRIVEQHRGRIWVESTPEAGATFYFTIPKDPQYQY